MYIFLLIDKILVFYVGLCMKFFLMFNLVLILVDKYIVKIYV